MTAESTISATTTTTMTATKATKQAVAIASLQAKLDAALLKAQLIADEANIDVEATAKAKETRKIYVDHVQQVCATAVDNARAQRAKDIAQANRTFISAMKAAGHATVLVPVTNTKTTLTDSNTATDSNTTTDSMEEVLLSVASRSKNKASPYDSEGNPLQLRKRVRNPLSDVIQNGVRRPGPGTAGDTVWAAADRVLQQVMADYPADTAPLANPESDPNDPNSPRLPFDYVGAVTAASVVAEVKASTPTYMQAIPDATVKGHYYKWVKFSA